MDKDIKYTSKEEYTTENSNKENEVFNTGLMQIYTDVFLNSQTITVSLEGMY